MEKNALKVTVVIPMYNKRDYIGRCLRSVIGQEFGGFEVIVVDDGSTDEGSCIVESFGDSRIRLVRQSNQGVSTARNLGVRLASSELVAFLDADDEWYPHFLQTVLDLKQRYPSAGAYATAYDVESCTDGVTSPTFHAVPQSPEGGIIQDYFLAALHYPPVCSSAVMIPKRILEEIGGFPVGVAIGEDLDTWVRIALRYRIAWSAARAAVYHMSAANRACDKLIVGDVQWAQTLEDHLRDRPDTLESLAHAVEYVAKFRLQYAQHYWLAGDVSMSRELLRKCRDTKLFRREWLLWRMITLLPRPLMFPLWVTRQRILGRNPTIGPTTTVKRDPEDGRY